MNTLAAGSAYASENAIQAMYVIGSHCAMLHKERERAFKWARLAFAHGAEVAEQVRLVTLLRRPVKRKTRRC